MPERRLGHQAASELEAAGFVIQHAVRAETIGRRTVLIDIVAWSGSADGELEPELAVEVKRRGSGDHLAAAAMQLGYYLPLVGASRAYVFDGTWHLVSSDFETTTPVECPHPTRGTARARAPLRLLEPLLWSSFHAMHGAGRTTEASWQFLLDNFTSSGGESPLDARLLRIAGAPQNGPRLAEALVRILQRFETSASGIGQYFTPTPLNEALARLLAPQSGWIVADPFCGLGGALIAVNEEGRRRGLDFTLVGADLVPHIAEDARKLFLLAGVKATIQTGDSLLQMPTTVVDGVVTVPPIGLKLHESRSVLLGGTTRDLTILAIDKILASLSEGGRAVVLMLPALLFAGGATEEFRRRLAEKARVVTVIELPPRLLPGTAIPCAIVVLEKAAPTDTLVARLEGDWQSQLSDEGEFMKAYRQHLGAEA
jgi:hypothetical protein